MWISKKKQQKMESEFHSIELERDEWKAKYLAAVDGKTVCVNKAMVVSQEFLTSWIAARNVAEMKLKQTIQELDEYKQKYADEVQKRIDLVKQMKG